MIVPRFGYSTEHVVQPACLPTVGHRATGLSIVIEIAVHIDFIAQTIGREILEQYDVDDLPAAAHIELARGAADNLYVVNLIRGNAIHLTAGLIVFACGSLAIDQDLAATTATAQPSATIATALTGPSGILIRASCGRAYAGNTVQHVLDGDRIKLREVGGRIHYRGFFAYIVLGEKRRRYTKKQKKSRKSACYCTRRKILTAHR